MRTAARPSAVQSDFWLSSAAADTSWSDSQGDSTGPSYEVNVKGAAVYGTNLELRPEKLT